MFVALGTTGGTNRIDNLDERRKCELLMEYVYKPALLSLDMKEIQKYLSTFENKFYRGKSVLSPKRFNRKVKNFKYISSKQFCQHYLRPSLADCQRGPFEPMAPKVFANIELSFVESSKILCHAIKKALEKSEMEAKKLEMEAKYIRDYLQKLE